MKNAPTANATATRMSRSAKARRGVGVLLPDASDVTVGLCAFDMSDLVLLCAGHSQTARDGAGYPHVNNPGGRSDYVHAIAN
jgi:hypothetical protein